MSGIGLALVLAGCGSTPTCTSGDIVVAEEGGLTLVCDDAEAVESWIETLAGRPLAPGDNTLVDRGVAKAFRAAPKATADWIATVRKATAELTYQSDFPGAELRAAAVYEAQAGTSLIGPDRSDLWAIQKRTLAVWAHHDGDGLALTEADVEGWIRYASLCREAQGGVPLRISVADRVAVYRMLVDRFDGGTRADRIALSAVGGWWSQIKEAWARASYDEQRAWIAAAPLPPPMTATSLGYAEAVFQSDVSVHAHVVAHELGPFRPTVPAAAR